MVNTGTTGKVKTPKKQLKKGASLPSTSTSTMTTPESEANTKLRFQIELEFVQCLANPKYIHFLAQRGYFDDPNFIQYLKYLQYWKEPEYARFLKYPTSLYFLDLLQHPEFRKELVNARCAKFVEDQQLLHWLKKKKCVNVNDAPK